VSANGDQPSAVSSLCPYREDFGLVRQAKTFHGAGEEHNLCMAEESGGRLKRQKTYCFYVTCIFWGFLLFWVLPNSAPNPPTPQLPIFTNAYGRVDSTHDPRLIVNHYNSPRPLI